MNWVEAGFWFLFGFIVCAVMSYRAQARQRDLRDQSFRVAKAEIIRLINAVRDVTEIKITITDNEGELEVEAQEVPVEPRSKPH